LSNFGRTFCGAVGTSLISNAWNDRTILHHVRLTEQASVTNPVFTQQLDTTRSLLHLSPDSALAFFNASVDSQAAVMGLNDIFYVSAIIFIAIIPLIWITKPARSGGGDADAAAAGAH
ncbi:TPA: EmrB/QacA family drug resistance transporter, partial [Burkholderia cenocepacia]